MAVSHSLACLQIAAPQTLNPVGDTVLKALPQSARLVGAERSLWRSASAPPLEKKTLLATPLPKRIAARKLKRNAQKAFVQDNGPLLHSNGLAQPEQKFIKQVDYLYLSLCLLRSLHSQKNVCAMLLRTAKSSLAKP